MHDVPLSIHLERIVLAHRNFKRRHALSLYHLINAKDADLRSRLMSIPAPTRTRCAAIGAHVLAVTNSVTDNLTAVTNDINDVLEALGAKIEPYRLRLYGSRASGAALRHANINVEIIYDNTEPKEVVNALETVAERLRELSELMLVITA